MLNVYKSTLVLVAILSTSSVFAVESFRTRTPILSGTQLVFPQGECTAGLVLKKTGMWENMTPYRRAVRYVLTASHCGRTNDDVKVGNQVVGKFVWRSERSDLRLVRIEPSRRNFTHCSAPSTGLTCSIVTTYEPLALGKIFVSTTGIALSIRGTGAPNTNEVFCTSGHTTGINCTWGKVPTPPGWMHPVTPEITKSAETYGRNVEGGDSGGPVASFGTRGLIYGIISTKGMHWSEHPNKMTYVPIAQFFQEQPGYEIAPSN